MVETVPGARYESDQCTFVLYAPTATRAWLVLPDSGTRRDMVPVAGGYFRLVAPDLTAGTRYLLQTNEMAEPRPDPASLWQPMGVHGYSVVVDQALFARTQPLWNSRLLDDMVLYELHVGTFTEAGTLTAAIDHLPDLVKLGINAVELMPLNQCPGERNWGYDGVYWCAVQANYGGPEALVHFIDAAHALDLSVLVDAVYNHLGPEGNYLPEFAPYHTDKHQTPWGPAINLDDAHCDGVRDLILASAKTWLVDYGADGLRLDAVHALRDQSAYHLLQALSEAVQGWQKQLGRPLTLVAESDLNDPRYLTPTGQHGLGLQGQWVDEVHHALRARVTGEVRDYFSDYGSAEALEKAMNTGYVHTGQYSAHRRRRYGKAPSGLVPSQFVVYGQNHDQVGNRTQGERLNTHLSEDEYLLVAATVLWSPFTPMLWMGEEYAETAPFPFFVDHGDPNLLRSTRKGRQRELGPFLKEGERVPDPGAEKTFTSAKLSHRRTGRVYAFYREALAARRRYFATRDCTFKAHHAKWVAPEVLGWRMARTDGSRLNVLVNFSTETHDLDALVPTWHLTALELACASKPQVCGQLLGLSAGLWVG